MVLLGDAVKVFEKLIKEYNVNSISCNRDYEPYAIKRDNNVANFLKNHSIEFTQSKDSVIFEPHEVLKDNGEPYTVYTPFKNKWLQKFKSYEMISDTQSSLTNLLNFTNDFPSLNFLDFEQSKINVRDYDLNNINHYAQSRDFPSTDGTSYLLSLIHI